MVQQQIVEYAKTQLGLGISEEVVKNALIQAGWSSADVEDSIKSVAPKKAATSFSPVSTSASPVSRPSSSGQGVSSSQQINLKDIFGGASKESISVASSSPASSVSSSGSVKAKPPETLMAKKPVSVPSASSPVLSVTKPGGSSKIVLIALAILALVGVGGSVYFYMNVSKLNGQIVALTADNSTTASQTANLSAQVTDLNKSKDDLQSKLTASMKNTEELRGQLLFFVAPAVASGTATSSAQVSFSLKGVLTFDSRSAQYMVSAPSGLKVSIKNSRDQKVEATLRTLIGTSVEISGTHTKLSRDVTITAVNGTSL